MMGIRRKSAQRDVKLQKQKFLYFDDFDGRQISGEEVGAIEAEQDEWQDHGSYGDTGDRKVEGYSSDEEYLDEKQDKTVEVEIHRPAEDPNNREKHDLSESANHAEESDDSSSEDDDDSSSDDEARPGTAMDVTGHQADGADVDDDRRPGTVMGKQGKDGEGVKSDDDDSSSDDDEQPGSAIDKKGDSVDGTEGDDEAEKEGETSRRSEGQMVNGQKEADEKKMNNLLSKLKESASFEEDGYSTPDESSDSESDAEKDKDVESPKDENENKSGGETARSGDSENDDQYGGNDPDNVAEGLTSTQTFLSKVDVKRGKEHKGSILQLLDGKRDVEINSIALTQEQVSELSNYIKDKDNLQSVSILNGGLDDEDIKLLSETLKTTNAKLTVLNLNLNMIGPVGGSHVANILRTTPSIQTLFIHGNPLGDEGVKSLVSTLKELHEAQINANIMKMKYQTEAVVEPIIAPPSLQVGVNSEHPHSSSLEQKSMDSEIIGNVETKAEIDSEDSYEDSSDSDSEDGTNADKDQKKKKESSESESGSESEREGEQAETMAVPSQEHQAGGSDTDAIEELQKWSAAPSSKKAEIPSEQQVNEKTAIDQSKPVDSKPEPKFCMLKELDIGNTKMTSDAAKAVASLLEENTGLVTLHMNANPDIGKFGWKAIFRALAENHHLTTLTLDYNEIGDYGLACLADGLKDNSTLRTLDLENAGIGEKGGRLLLDLLKRNITILDMTLNPGNSIPEEILEDIRKYLSLNRTTVAHNKLP